MHDNNELQMLRHSAAHLLAHAVSELYPDTLMTIGPATQDGFFYDMLPVKSFSMEDLPKIHARMQEIVQQNLPITHEQMDKDKARRLFANNRFKLELIDSIPGETVGIARQGSFVDLCKGGHVNSTGVLQHTLLTGMSGSYWRADKKNTVLQRISGTAFFTQEALDQWKAQREAALQYDHRTLGKQMELFSFQEEAPGFPFFHPKGKAIINLMVDFMRKEQTAQGYQEVSTPICLNNELWKRSGHYEFYKDNMYCCMIDEHEYAIKPMNCPGAFLMYKDRPRSYKELPLRLAEFGLVHRHELSGVLQGLLRVRAFTQDDAHIFCMPEQLISEIEMAIKLVQRVAAVFQFSDIKVALSTRPDNAMGDPEAWVRAEDALAQALKNCNLAYVVQEKEGAFYGPKIEFKILDSWGREWQCGTIQVDFFQSENFDLSYVASTGLKERPVIIHRAIYGSLERFFAIITEHFKGKFPFWLAPVQAVILPITSAQDAYAHQVYQQIKDSIRCTVDDSRDPINGKIKNAQMHKIPWMIIVGKQEAAQNTVSLRYADGTQNQNITIEDVLQKSKNS